MKFLKTLFFISLAGAVVVSVYFIFPDRKVVLNNQKNLLANSVLGESSSLEEAETANTKVFAEEIEEPKEPEFVVTHVQTPESVKSIYMSSWVAGTPSFRNKLVKIIDDTEINAVVIDIKDYTGKVSFKIPGSQFEELESTENRISDIKEFIGMLHSKGVYVIGRISVFQDPHLVKIWPEEAVKKGSDHTLAWKDRKGISWIDAGSEKVWDYILDLSRVSYEYGFDEINFDYIRFPSDGDMKDIYFPYSEGESKSETMKLFFEFLSNNLITDGEDRVKISADIFGMTTVNTDDLGIGQILEDALLNFDYVAPMVYPSHFPDTWGGIAKPAEKPYEVIKKSMSKAVERAVILGEDPKKLRPWLQDFDLGANYSAEMVRLQIDATYDSGLDSWMLWDPKNIYKKDALLPEKEYNE